ncbi:hypothetical protein ABK040_000076 [Willaertia magna]
MQTTNKKRKEAPSTPSLVKTVKTNNEVKKSSQQQPTNSNNKNQQLETSSSEPPKKKEKINNNTTAQTNNNPIIEENLNILSKDLLKSLPNDPHFQEGNKNKKENKKDKKINNNALNKSILPQKSKKKLKSELRKEKKLKEKKEKDELRSKLIESHQKHSFNEEQLQALKSLKYIGIGNESTKQQLQRLAIYQKMGIDKEEIPSVEKAEKYWKKRENKVNQLMEDDEVKEVLYGKEDKEKHEKIKEELANMRKEREEQEKKVEKTEETEEKKPLLVLDFFGNGPIVNNAPSKTNAKEEAIKEKKKETMESMFYRDDEDPLAGLIQDTFNKSHLQLIDELIEELDSKKTDEEKAIRYTKFYVKVDRKPEIQEQRMALPICGEEQRIMETINENEIVVVRGETGSGKTTQIPQFLYEYGYGCKETGYPGIIGITQPRRVAAVSTARRVAEELNVVFGEEVAFQVRFDKNVNNEKTKIKFMTDGILMREIQNDPLLLNYSVIALDEIHERNVNTDILIGWLSRFIPQRNRMARAGMSTPQGTPITPLKLIIMSATLQLENFTENQKLFPISPPVVDVQSRQYPVSIHFNRRTVFGDYVDAAYKKVVKIHEKLPNGGILIFLTGRKEIEFLCDKLKKYSNKRFIEKKRRIEKEKELRKKREGREGENKEEEEKPKTAEEEEEAIKELGDLSDSDVEDDEEMKDMKEKVGLDKDENLFDDEDEEDEEDEENAMKDEGEDEEKKNPEKKKEKGKNVTLFEDCITSESLKLKGKENNETLNQSLKQERLYVLPLYAMLQPKEQMKVFQPPPPGYRLVVIATNVAETSLTIPNIRYVVDCGRVKEKYYEKSTGIFKFQIGWVSQASSNQRAGRAGRTGPGHCYRLFSSAVFDQQFKDYTEPDILRAPVENIILQMKSMGIKQIDRFPFPTPPEGDAVRKGSEVLVNLGALDKYLTKEGLVETMITNLGMAMNRFPLHPRFAKMLILSNSNPEFIRYAAAVVSAMTVNQIFMHDNHLSILKEKVERMKQENMKQQLQELGMRSDGLKKNKKMIIDVDELNEIDAMKKKIETENNETNEEEEEFLTQEEKNLRKRCQVVKELWSHSTCDYLAMVKAIGAYFYAEDPREFCLEYFLHQKNMREISKLYRQLLRIVRSELKASFIEVDQDEAEVDEDEEENETEVSEMKKSLVTDFPTPKDTEEEQQEVESAVRQILCAGLIDQVARLANEDDLTHMEDISFRDSNRPYVTIQLGRTVPVFIHPSSYLFGRHPEYVVYTELTKSRKNKTYMKGITAIEPNWISRFGNHKCGFVKFSAPLETPTPFYDAEDDCVKCYVRPSIHQSNSNVVWTLPIEITQYKDSNKQLHVFAKALLEGKVFDSIKLNTKQLSDINNIIQSKRFDNMIFALKKLFNKDTLCSRKKLLEYWKNNPKYLYKELCETLQTTIPESQWPPKK